MSILEADIENRAVKYARDRGYITLKLTPQGQKGWPDRIFINQYGLHIYIEFKRPNEKLRKLQEYRCSKLIERNVIVYRGVDTLEEAKRILSEHIYDTPSGMEAARISAERIKQDV